MAFDVTVRVNARLRDVLRTLQKVPDVASGNRGGATVAVQRLQVRLGLATLDMIKELFLVKARGGTDETGLRWQPLSPKTIAYSRRHPGVPRQSTRARYAPSWMLSRRQRDRWWQLYSQALARFKGDKSHAAAYAWFISKQEGARTLLGVYGQTKVEILRDTGLLYNSLVPGQTPPTTPGVVSPTTPRRPKEQVFRYRTGEVTIGTSRKWAGTHHRGIPGRLPQRRLWPPPERWTARMWGLILTQAQLGVLDLITYLLGRINP